MYQNLQYPYSPTAVNLTTPYSGQNGFQTAVPMPSAQITNPNVIFGKRVGRASDITPNDVPMDGTIGYFPTNENTIISKKWNSDGTIETVVYVPKEPEVSADEDKFDILLERLDSLEKKVAALSKASKREEAKG